MRPNKGKLNVLCLFYLVIFVFVLCSINCLHLNNLNAKHCLFQFKMVKESIHGENLF